MPEIVRPRAAYFRIDVLPGGKRSDLPERLLCQVGSERHRVACPPLHVAALAVVRDVQHRSVVASIHPEAVELPDAEANHTVDDHQMHWMGHNDDAADAVGPEVIHGGIDDILGVYVVRVRAEVADLMMLDAGDVQLRSSLPLSHDMSLRVANIALSCMNASGNLTHCMITRTWVVATRMLAEGQGDDSRSIQTTSHNTPL